MIELDRITRRFGTTTALADVSLQMPAGSFTSLLGPSGCGKSTLLRIIAGLDRPTSGAVRINGRDVVGLTASQRNIAMVFQSYALYPHMSVRENITLPLAMRNLSRLERLPGLNRLLPSARRKRAGNAETVRRVAQMLEIDALLARKPSELSGGQKQRVAIGRALVRDPVAFLLDEPLSNLDAKLRIQMRAEIVDLHQRTGRTFVYVTHDQAEAMSMSDRIAVFKEGRILQVGAPRDLYEAPASRDVAAFIGDRTINLVEIDVADGRLAPPFEAFAVAAKTAPARCVLGIRPEALRLDASGPLRGTVEAAEYHGSDASITLRLSGGTRLSTVVDGASALPAPTEEIGLSFDPARAHLFDAATGNRLDATLVPRNGAAGRRAAGERS